jgi:glycosyltransferase involved in cell wall biosynthesis
MKYEAVIAAKEASEFIGETLESLLNATIAPVQIWVIDDASDDNTGAIAASYDRVTVIRNKVNQERSVSRNIGIERCTSPYIQIIDADDLLAPDKVERQIKYLESHSDVGAVFGDKSIFSTHKDDPNNRRQTYHDVDDILKEIIKLNTIVPGMLLFRKSFFKDYGLFDENIVIAEDRELLIRALLNGAQIDYTPGALLHYRRHEGSSVNSQYAKGIWNNVLMFEKLFDQLVTYKEGAYEQDTVDAVRNLARNLNIYAFPMDAVYKTIELAESTNTRSKVTQSLLYDLLQKVVGQKGIEALLRPKFNLDRKLGRI